MRRHQQGFALIAVLSLLMVLSLIASFIAGYAEQRIEQAQDIRQRLQDQLDSDATLATLLHLIATRPLQQNAYLAALPPATPAAFPGFGQSEATIDLATLAHLRVDGQLYSGLGNSLFAIQDEGSLLSLLDPDRTRWSLLFQQLGHSPQQADRFLDQLLDYTDRDDLRRINGANAADYQARGLPAPPQRLLISPAQIHELLDAPALRDTLVRLLPLATARSGQLHNLNTAPAAVLQTIPGLEPDLAQAIADERRQRPFASLADANQRLGRIIPLDPLAVPTQASAFLRLLLWSDRHTCRQPIWVGISSTPTSRLTPWEIDYSFAHPHEQSCAAPQPLDFPPLFEPPMAR